MSRALTWLHGKDFQTEAIFMLWCSLCDLTWCLEDMMSTLRCRFVHACSFGATVHAVGGE